MSLHCEKNWGETLKTCFSWCRGSGRESIGTVVPFLFLRRFSPFVLLLFCGFPNEVCSRDRHGALWSQSVDISGKKERERERWRKTKRQSGLLKSSRASAGATTRVQAQLCNKEQRGWMRETEEWGGGGGCWWKAPSDVSLCSVPLSSSHPLMKTHPYTHTHI